MRALTERDPMTTTALAHRVLPDQIDGNGLPDLHEFQDAIRELVSRNDGQSLDEVRRRAEAMSLYEKGRGYADNEKHYAKLRLLAEAALGILSFEDSSILEKKDVAKCRALAAVFERGKLWECVDGAESTNSQNIAWFASYNGYTRVPGKALEQSDRESLLWRDARVIAMELGRDFRDLPTDKAYVRYRVQAGAGASRRMSRLLAAQKRLERMNNMAATSRGAQDVGPNVAAAYSLLRRTLQAAHDAQKEFPPHMRKANTFHQNLEDVFYHLYQAEDALSRMIRLLSPADTNQAQ